MCLNQISIENIKLFCAFSHIHTKHKQRNGCKQVFLDTTAFPQSCGFNKIKLFPLHYLFLEFGWIFPSLYEVWERTNTPHLCSLLGECWWRYWFGVETAVYYVFWGVLRYWFRLMWLTTVSSCAKWPHQSLLGQRFRLKLRKQRPVSDFQFFLQIEFLVNWFFVQFFVLHILSVWVINHIKQIYCALSCATVGFFSSIFFISGIVLFDLHSQY